MLIISMKYNPVISQVWHSVEINVHAALSDCTIVGYRVLILM